MMYVSEMEGGPLVIVHIHTVHSRLLHILGILPFIFLYSGGFRDMERRKEGDTRNVE